MDDTYAINLAKTEFQEAWNTGDVRRLLGVISEGHLDLSAERPSFYGPEAKVNLREVFERLHREYQIRLDVTIINIQIAGNMAVDLGWEDWVLTPRAGGQTVRRRNRYMETWAREGDGQWRIAAFLNNPDLPPQMLMAS